MCNSTWDLKRETLELKILCWLNEKSLRKPQIFLQEVIKSFLYKTWVVSCKQVNILPQDLRLPCQFLVETIWGWEWSLTCYLTRWTSATVTGHGCSLLWTELRYKPLPSFSIWSAVLVIETKALKLNTNSGHCCSTNLPASPFFFLLLSWMPE